MKAATWEDMNEGVAQGKERPGPTAWACRQRRRSPPSGKALDLLQRTLQGAVLQQQDQLRRYSVTRRAASRTHLTSRASLQAPIAPGQPPRRSPSCQPRGLRELQELKPVASPGQGDSPKPAGLDNHLWLYVACALSLNS